MLYLEGMLASKLRPEFMLRNSHAAAVIPIWLLLLLRSRRRHGFLLRSWRWLNCALLSIFVLLHPGQFQLLPCKNGVSQRKREASTQESARGLVCAARIHRHGPAQGPIISGRLRPNLQRTPQVVTHA